MNDREGGKVNHMCRSQVMTKLVRGVFSGVAELAEHLAEAEGSDLFDDAMDGDTLVEAGPALR